MNTTSASPLNFFRGTRGNRSGRIMIVGESYGRTEAMKNQPFVGATGEELERILFECKIPITECFFTNVINERPENNDMTKFFYTNKEVKDAAKAKIPHVEFKGLYPHQNVLDGIRNLREQIKAVKPDIIVGLGNYAAWALCDTGHAIGASKGYKAPQGIGSWRGSQLYTSQAMGAIPFLPTYHPAAALQHTPAWRYMIVHDIKTRVPKALTKKPEDWNEPPYEFIIQPSFDACTKYLLQLLSLLNSAEADGSDEGVEVVCDLETSITRRIISCIGLSFERGRAMCIPLLCSYREDGYWHLEEEYEIVQLLRRVFSHPKLHLIGHNFLFDSQYIIDQLWIKPRIGFDTMIGQHTLWPGGGDPNDPNAAKTVGQGIQKKSLSNCASLYCDHYYFWKDEGKDFGDAASGRDELQGWAYNCRDCVKTFEVYDAEKALLKRFDLQSQFDHQMRTANDFALEMMINGVKSNTVVKAEVTKELADALERFDDDLYNIIPEEIRREVEPKAFRKDKKTGVKSKTPWYTSPKQQKQIFIDIMGIRPVTNKKKDKNGDKTITFNKEALPILAQREPIIAPLVEKLEVRRSIGVYHSTFAESKADPDNRFRCSYNVTGTDTFRFSSSENVYGRGGNFQNIPSGKEADEEDTIQFKFPNMRRCFEPDIGYEIAEFDQSGADATIVAWEANDEPLKQAFREGKKVHLINARLVFEYETRNMTDEEILAGSGIPGTFYDRCKKAGHACNYGAQASVLAHRLKWKLTKAEEFVEKWFTAHPGILNWQHRTDRYLNGLQCWKCDKFTNGANLCPKCGSPTGRTVANKFGFRIVYFDFMNDLLKKALAWQGQSSVGINTNKAALAVKDSPECSEVQFLLQVHDSIVVQYPIHLSDTILPAIKSALHSISVPFKDPLTIQWGPKASRKSWGDCEKISW